MMIRHKIILSSFIFALLSPAPAALAQDECGPGPTVECDQTTYANGITYDSAVDLSVTATDGPTTVEANGVNLTGAGSASIVWDSTIGSPGGSFGGANFFGGDMTDGPVLDVLTDSGDIEISTRGINASSGADTVTHGIRARSTGGGSILVDDRHDAGTIITAVNATSGIAAIEAVSSGGDGDVEIFYGDRVQGTQYGIIAEAAGGGDLTIRGEIDTTFNNNFTRVRVDRTAGVAAIHATTGTGTLRIDTRAQGQSGTGVIIDAGGDVVFTGSATGDQYGVDLLNVAPDTTSTLNFINSSFGGIATARAQGGGTVIVNLTTPEFDSNPSHGVRNLDFDFTGLPDTVQVNVINEAVWTVHDMATTVPDGNFDIFIGENGGFSGGLDLGSNISAPFPGPFVVQFAGADRLLVNEGFFAVGEILQQTEVRLEGLAEFRHSGRILLGSNGSTGLDIIGEPREFIGDSGDGFTINRTDARTDDVLAVPDANWVGEGGEIWFDVDLSGGQSQDSCARGGDGSLPAADCLELHGTTTSGVTHLVLADPLAFDRGRLVPGQEIVLVDVSGGNSEQGHFVVGPNQPGYSPLFGGSWDRGFFQYAITYDEDAQTHSLAGMINGSAHQQAQLASTAHDLWRTSTATSLDRQADLRNRGKDENGGLWLRFSNETADRDIVNVEQAGGQDFSYNNSFSRDAYAVTFGLDMLAGGAGDSAWVFGAMGGYVNSDVDYNVSPNRAEINGWSLGAYAGYVAGPLWVDGAVNINEATLRQHIPGLNLNPPDTLVSNDLRSVGAQVDAGWRIDLTNVFFVEPLASVSYVSTRFDTLNIEPDDSSRPGLDLDWDDPTSLRAGLGGRVGTDYDLGFMRGQASLTAKVWNESDGESVMSIHNNAFPDDPDHRVKSTFDDTVTEVSVGASIRSPGDAVSGFINLGGATASDYDTFTAKLGVRYQW